MFGRIDWDDRFFGAIFLLSSAVSVGLLTVPGTDLLSKHLFVIGEGAIAAGFSVAKIVSVICLLVIIATNRTDFSKFVGIEFWAAVTTIGLVVAPPFMPLLDAILQGSFIAGGFSVLLQAGGVAIISKLG